MRTWWVRESVRYVSDWTFTLKQLFMYQTPFHDLEISILRLFFYLYRLFYLFKKLGCRDQRLKSYAITTLIVMLCCAAGMNALLEML